MKPRQPVDDKIIDLGDFEQLGSAAAWVGEVLEHCRRGSQNWQGHGKGNRQTHAIEH